MIEYITAIFIVFAVVLVRWYFRWRTRAGSETRKDIVSIVDQKSPHKEKKEILISEFSDEKTITESISSETFDETTEEEHKDEEKIVKQDAQERHQNDERITESLNEKVEKPSYPIRKRRERKKRQQTLESAEIQKTENLEQKLKIKQDKPKLQDTQHETDSPRSDDVELVPSKEFFLSQKTEQPVINDEPAGISDQKIQPTSTPKLTQDKADEILKLERKRNFIIKEFLTTERTYVNNLKIIVERYLRPLKNILSQQKLHNMFGDIEIVYGINSMFLRELEQIIDDKNANTLNLNSLSNMRLADMLVKFSQSFKLYTTYISNYNKYIDTIRREKNKNEKFSKFLDATSYELKNEGERICDIYSFMILPIQRLPRYRLLMEDLLKKTSRSNEIVYKKVLAATEAIKTVANYCNQKQHEIQNLIRITEIQSKLRIKIIKPNRKLIKEEETTNLQRIRSNGKLARCDEVYLFSDLLVIVAKKKMLGMRPKYTIPLDVNDQEERFMVYVDKLVDTEFENAFYVSNQNEKRTVKLVCSSAEERDAWIDIIQKQITLNKEAFERMKGFKGDNEV